MRRTVAIASATSGLALLVGSPAVSLAGRPATAVGQDPAVVHTEVAAAPDLRPPASPPSPSPVPTDPAPSVDAPGPAAVAPPATLALPTLGVDAAVTEVGLLADGTLEIPDDVTTVGWYGLGVAPGAPGTALLAGHVDSREQGPGALFELSRLDVGDLAVVTDTDGGDDAWQVVGRRSYPKTQVPLAELVGDDGPPRLAVLTCGGAFDPATRSYEDNVVVVLEPA